MRPTVFQILRALRHVLLRRRMERVRETVRRRAAATTRHVPDITERLNLYIPIIDPSDDSAEVISSEPSDDSSEEE